MQNTGALSERKLTVFNLPTEVSSSLRPAILSYSSSDGLYSVPCTGLIIYEGKKNRFFSSGNF